MKQEPKSQYWLDVEVAKIIDKYPDGEIVVSSGHSPSGKYHIGTLREVVTASAVWFAIKQTGRKVTHIDFVDDFDALRKIPAGVPDHFEKYLGMPLFLVPSPEHGFNSYADYYLNDLYKAYEKLDLNPRIYRSHEQYQSGKYTDYIEKALDNIDEIKRILQEVSKRRLDDNWAPVQLLSNDNYLNQWKYKDWDRSKKEIIYEDENGKKGRLKITEAGRVKLDWRLDWPARWHMFGVSVEPFGRDHAAKGGSYDTGKEIVELFNGKPPYPLPYEFISVAGHTKKLSKSAGNVITPLDALKIMPPEVLRYFIVKSRPGKALEFDAGKGLYNLIDEYSKIKHEYAHVGDTKFKEAYLFATQVNRDSLDAEVIANIPFSHLVTVYQAARGDLALTNGLLSRTGYEVERTYDFSILEREFEFIKNWLESYAPDSVKFSLQEELPALDLEESQMKFLADLASRIETEKELDAEWVHAAIYELKDKYGLKPAQVFRAIYRVLLGQDSGPKAGWFLTTLDKDWLVKRLKLEA